MSLTKIRSAAAVLAESLHECLDGIRNVVPEGAAIYSVSLVITDDFESLMAYANTDAHFAESPGGMLDKWYFAEWWSEGMDIETEPLLENLDEVEDFDDEPETGNAPHWLAAMTEALRIVRRNGTFKSAGPEPLLFCSMLDSDNAVWLEECSARFLNSPEAYEAVATELASSAKEWYGNAQGRQQYQAAYTALLAQLTDEN